MTCCTSELTAGYAADGYARESSRLGCVVVTYGVGALSVMNGVAGAFAENVPMVVLCGRPQLTERSTGYLTHHSAGESFEQSRCFEAVTAAVVTVFSAETLPCKLEKALITAIAARKPVLLEVACDLFLTRVDFVSGQAFIPSSLHFTANNSAAAQCVRGIVQEIKKSARPVIVIGKQVDAVHRANLRALAKALHCPVTCQPDAKGLYDETAAEFIGVCWGSLSSELVEAIVDESDLELRFGCVVTDFNTVGHSGLSVKEKRVDVSAEFTRLSGRFGQYHNCLLSDVLQHLADLTQRDGALPQKPGALLDFQRLCGDDEDRHDDSFSGSIGIRLGSPPRGNLRLKHVQEALQREVRKAPTALVVDTGDSMFWVLTLTLTLIQLWILILNHMYFYIFIGTPCEAWSRQLNLPSPNAVRVHWLERWCSPRRGTGGG